MEVKAGSAGLQPGNDRKQAEQELGAPGELAASRPGWHSRGYLPHRDEVGLLQFLTFRLADSLPQEKLRRLEEELAFTGRWALAHNAELELGVPGTVFWMREYWDRFIRNENHLQQTIAYIHLNPAKAGLCTSPPLWHWSSARHGMANEPTRIA